ncbi:hypothetical protein BC827DRAFT_437138 [Russula dissimulans]|nr:hypothetical protein BC827DRAFT_437138 [Russula dissimulans]
MTGVDPRILFSTLPQREDEMRDVDVRFSHRNTEILYHGPSPAKRSTRSVYRERVGGMAPAEIGRNTQLGGRVHVSSVSVYTFVRSLCVPRHLQQPRVFSAIWWVVYWYRDHLYRRARRWMVRAAEHAYYARCRVCIFFSRDRLLSASNTDVLPVQEYESLPFGK